MSDENLSLPREKFEPVAALPIEGVCPNQAHFHQRKLIDKQPVGIFLAAVFFFRTESHVQFVSLDILWPEALALFIAQQLPADKHCVCDEAGIPFYILDAPLYQDFLRNFGQRRTVSIPWWTLMEDGHKAKMPRNCTIDKMIAS